MVDRRAATANDDRSRRAVKRAILADDGETECLPGHRPRKLLDLRRTQRPSDQAEHKFRILSPSAILAGADRERCFRSRSAFDFHMELSAAGPGAVEIRVPANRTADILHSPSRATVVPHRSPHRRIFHEPVLLSAAKAGPATAGQHITQRVFPRPTIPADLTACFTSPRYPMQYPLGGPTPS